MNEGFWTQLGAAATVDWCEGNYLWNPWVAEWWNTWTSFLLCLAGLAGLWNCLRSGLTIERRYQVIFGLIALVGAGSMGFHGTLLRSMQVLDELPMVYASLCLLYCARMRAIPARPSVTEKTTLRRWQLGILVYSIAFTSAYFLHEATFQIFIASFAGAVGLLALWGLRIAHGPDADPTLRRLVYFSIAGFGIAVGVFWMPERHLGCTHAFQTIEPHAFFHLFAILGTYGANLAFIYDRQRCLGRQAHITFKLPAPFITSSEKEAPKDS
jgi:dihydroceramidase